MENNENEVKTVAKCDNIPQKSHSRFKWQLWLVWLLRFVAGGTFVFSGFVKAVDPWGTIYKMQEYFAALGFGEWTAVCLPLAFLLFATEFMTGIFLFIGCYRRLSPLFASTFMAVMLPLTLWIAIKSPVPDCGCFGDAWVISNKATLWKNVVLMLGVVWLLIHNRKARCLVTPALQWVAFCITVVFIIAVGWIGYIYQPLIDFRPYPVGSSLVSKHAQVSDDDEVNMMGVWQKGEERITIPIDSIPSDDSWTFVERIGGESKSMNSTPQNESQAAVFDSDGEDMTAEILGSTGRKLLLLYPSLSDISPAGFYRTNSLQKYCDKHNMELSAVAAATPEQIDAFRDLSLSEFPIYLAEDTWIKEVVRGNPGVVYMSDGKIRWKSSLKAMTPDDFMSPDAPTDFDAFSRNNENILGSLLVPYVLAMLLLIVLSLIPSVVRRIASLIHNRFVKDTTAPLVLIAALTFSATSCSDKNNEPPLPAKSCESTTLIYMVGNNSLSDNVWNDISEMYRGCDNIDLDKNNVVVYLAQPGNIPGYADNLPGLYKICKNTNGAYSFHRLVTYSDDLYSVDKERISKVMNDLQKYAPAYNYGLVLWSHATGWLPDINSFSSQKPERVFGDDYGRSIGIEELAAALPDDMFSYIWFDCCLMGGVESCYALRNKADYIVSSPTEIMAEGAPYHIILPFIAKRNPALIQAAEKEYQYYLNDAKSSLGFTISVVDCSKFEMLVTAAANIVGHQFPYISTAGLQRYGSYRVSLPDGMRPGVVFYDFGQVYLKYADERGVDPTVFSEALSQLVIYKVATPKFSDITINADKYSGLSVHLPLSPEAYGYNAMIDEFYNTLSWTRAVTQ